MKLHYYPETDSLYIEFSEEPGLETREVSDGVNVDIDARGNLVGFDIDRASNQLDLSSLETTALPLRSRRGTGSGNEPTATRGALMSTGVDIMSSVVDSPDDHG